MTTRLRTLRLNFSGAMTHENAAEMISGPIMQMFGGIYSSGPCGANGKQYMASTVTMMTPRIAAKKLREAFSSPEYTVVIDAESRSEELHIIRNEIHVLKP